MSAPPATDQEGRIKRLEALVALLMGRTSSGGGGGGGGTLTASFVQPSTIEPSNTVTASISSSAGLLRNGLLSVEHGGQYEVVSIPGPTSVVLRNLGGPDNAAAGATVPTASKVTATSSSNALALLGAPYSLSAVPVTFNVRDPQFGAVGDGVHDDTAAIELASAASKAVPGSSVFFPAGTYLVTSELLIDYRGHWKGDGVTLAQTIIRAGAPIRSCLAVRSTAGTPTPEGGAAYRCLVEHLTFDANVSGPDPATNAVYLDGAADSEFRDVRFINAPACGVRSPLYQTPAVLSAVTATVPGGSPAGVTVSQFDTGYLGNGAWETAGTYPMRLECAVGGALDTATFKVSFDNGATFQAFTQPISHVTFPAVGDASGVSAVSGIQANWPPGPYFANDHWDFTITTVNGDIAQPVAANFEIRYDNCVFQQSGTAYGTVAVIPRQAGNTVIVPGSVATTSGSTRVIGTGTQFTQMLMAGSSRMALWLNTGGPGTYFQILAVLSDTVLELTPETAPTFSTAGLDYTIGVGGGFYEDGLTEPGDQQIIGGHVDNVSVGMSFGAAFGPNIYRTEYTNCGLFAAMFGGNRTANGTARCVINNAQLNSQALNGYWFAPGSGGSWLQPSHQNLRFSGPATDWVVTLGAAIYQLGDGGILNLSLASLVLSLSNVFAYSTGSETIPIPDRIGAPTGNTSYVPFTTPSDLVITAAPVIATPNADGIVLILHNIGSHAAIFSASAGGQLSLSAVELSNAQIAIYGGETLMLISSGTRWYQFVPVCRIYRNLGDTASSAGDDGLAPVTTTGNTPTTIYTLLVDIGFDAIGVTFDVVGNTTGGAQSATWLGATASLDASGNLQGALNKGTARGSNAGVPPIGWDISITSPASNLVSIQVTGAAATTVFWKVKVRLITGTG